MDQGACWKFLRVLLNVLIFKHSPISIAKYCIICHHVILLYLLVQIVLNMQFLCHKCHKHGYTKNLYEYSPDFPWQTSFRILYPMEDFKIWRFWGIYFIIWFRIFFRFYLYKIIPQYQITQITQLPNEETFTLSFIRKIFEVC